MKKLLLVICLLVVPTLALGATWCEWSGTAGENCKTDNKNGIIRIGGVNVKYESGKNSRGYYELIVTEPAVSDTETKEVPPIWDFVANQITKTWTVRDLTAEELNARIAMGGDIYWLFKIVLNAPIPNKGEPLVTPAKLLGQGVPQWLIDSYLARKAIEGD
jgi:hypothetical protein